MKERIKKIIEEMNVEGKVALWDDYCSADNRYNDWIYFMEEFDEIMEGKNPWEIARSCFFGDFNPTHAYFWFNAYENLESNDWIDGAASPFYIDQLVDYIIENEEDFGNEEIAEVLEEE